MAPKKENPVSQADLETIMAKLSILDSLTEKIQALESLPRKIDSLEKLLQESNAKVVALQAEINTKDKIITDFKNKTNSLEQYNRKWSVRINNVTLPNGDDTDTPIVMETIYKKALLPILEGALSTGLIKKIPACDELLETAHILPAKNNDRPKPIIARFYSRNMRAMIFRLKKEYATYDSSPPTNSSSHHTHNRKTFNTPISKWELQSSDSIATYCPPYLKLTFSLELAVVSLVYNFVFSFKLCPSISESE